MNGNGTRTKARRDGLLALYKAHWNANVNVIMYDENFVGKLSYQTELNTERSGRKNIVLYGAMHIVQGGPNEFYSGN